MINSAIVKYGREEDIKKSATQNIWICQIKVHIRKSPKLHLFSSEDILTVPIHPTF